MKKFLIFFILFYLVACSNTIVQSDKVVKIECPNVFFSAENNVYIDGDNQNTDLENINYKAVLNNYGFVGDCLSNSINNIYILDILILVEPLNPNYYNISLPIFILLYDLNGNLLDKQYFRIEDAFNDNQITQYNLKEVVGNINIFLEAEKKVDSMTIGFVNIN